MDGKILVVIPTFNERENIREIVENIFIIHPDLNILVVDDASGDGTSDVADQLSIEYDKLSVMHRLGRRGRGAAVKDGLDYAVNNFFDFVIELDADGSHNPSEISRFLSSIDGYDLVIGSRYVRGGKALYESKIRYWMSLVSNFFNKIIIGLPFKDVTCDFRCYRVDCLRNINLDKIKSTGFVFGVEFLYLAVLNGLKVCEIPIEFHERVKGKSKTDWKVVLKYPLQVIRFKMRYSKKGM
jgi:dolichol-phosphate mannosyltransferase